MRFAMIILAFSTLAFMPARAAQRGTEPPVRELRDPTSGLRWLLYGSENGGPGRLVPAEPRSGVERPDRPQPSSNAVPVIRDGDRIVVVEQTAVVDASLEAVALGPAAQGSLLRARLIIGGHIVRAIAVGPGRARFASDGGMLP